MTTATLTPGLDGQLEKAVDPENNPIESTLLSSHSIRNEQYGSPAEPEPAAQRTVTGIRWFLVCVAIFSANILYGLDTTIVADIQAAVSETFDDVALLGWLGVGFTLGSTVAMLPLGKAFGTFAADSGCFSSSSRIRCCKYSIYLFLRHTLIQYHDKRRVKPEGMR